MSHFQMKIDDLTANIRDFENIPEAKVEMF
jgi:hypothetical protein